MQRSLGYYLLIIVLVLLLFGVVSLGDIFNLIFIVIGGLLLLVVIGVVAFRIYINRLRKKAESGQGGSHTFFWTNRQGYGAQSSRRQGNTSKEGDVKIKMTAQPKEKKVSDKVGDYVDFEVVDEDKK